MQCICSQVSENITFNSNLVYSVEAYYFYNKYSFSKVWYSGSFSQGYSKTDSWNCFCVLKCLKSTNSKQEFCPLFQKLPIISFTKPMKCAPISDPLIFTLLLHWLWIQDAKNIVCYRKTTLQIQMSLTLDQDCSVCSAV